MARDRAPVRSLGARLPPARRTGAARAVAILLVVAVALVVPPTLVVNALRALATESFTRWELDRLERDAYGLTPEQREALALRGLESIGPRSSGIELLEHARLPDGSRAFNERELSHMNDVRRVFGLALRAQLVTLLLLAGGALALLRTRFRTLVPRGLLVGALTTLGVAVLAVPVIVLGFDAFFTRFHEMFFEGDSWRFSDSDTLIRVYPEQLWIDVSRIAAALTVVQAVVLAGLSWWWLRAARRRAA